MIVMVNGKEIHVTHTMADGTKLESVEGYLKSASQLPPVARTLLVNLFADHLKRQVSGQKA
ncbi:MAG TPA: hypothetical protein PKB13_08715 [Clostridia bacterium]|nr:hypothetical protein [Clostridia bacterium]